MKQRTSAPPPPNMPHAVQVPVLVAASVKGPPRAHFSSGSGKVPYGIWVLTHCHQVNDVRIFKSWHVALRLNEECRLSRLQ